MCLRNPSAAPGLAAICCCVLYSFLAKGESLAQRKSLWKCVGIVDCPRKQLWVSAQGKFNNKKIHNHNLLSQIFLSKK